MTHRCSGCKKTVDEVAFYRNASRPSGLSNYCKPCETAKKAKRIKTPEYREKIRAYAKKRRMALIETMGGKCACCGESQYEFLQFDHINNDGAEHRRELGHTTLTVSVVAREPDRFQVLCCNCNFAKGSWGKCPHQD